MGVVGPVCAAVGARAEDGPTVDSSHGQLHERCQSRHSGVVLGSGEEADRGVEGGWVGQHGLAVSSLCVGVVGAVCAAVGARAEEGPTVDSSHGQLSIEDGRAIPRVDGKLYYSDMKSVARRVLIHVAGGRRIPIEPDEVFLLEAMGDETNVRTRGARKLRDVRSLGELERCQVSQPHNVVAIPPTRPQLAPCRQSTALS